MIGQRIVIMPGSFVRDAVAKFKSRPESERIRD